MNFINDGSQVDPIEKRADKFAAETLIPKRYDLQIKEVKETAGKYFIS